MIAARSSAIKAVFEFGEMRGVLAGDGTIGSGNGSLDIAQRGIDPFEGWRASRLGSGSGFDDLVCAPSVSDAGETLQTERLAVSAARAP
jgi:hypothetical protein